MKTKALAVLLLWVGCGYGQTSDSSLYVKVRLDDKFKAPALRSGDVVEGTLSQDVYSGDRELFPAGSRVRLVVDRLERRRRQPNARWPWILRLFAPRHENYPSFQTATVTPPSGSDAPLQVSLISINRRAEVRSTGGDKTTGQLVPKVAEQEGTAGPTVESAPQAKSGKKRAEVLMTLEAMRSASENLEAGTSESVTSASGVPSSVTLEAGTQARVILLSGVSASKNKTGDLFQARLIEPVRLGSRVALPEGTIFQGLVIRSTPPRRLSRSGSLLLKFTGVTLPGGDVQPIAGSVAGVELEATSHTRIDPEGRLKSSTGRAWTLLNAGVSTGIAKATDDGVQLLIEAISSTATDASTAGTSRIVAFCVSGMFIAAQRGRDVILPRFTEMNITLDRPATLSMSESGSQRRPADQQSSTNIPQESLSY